MNHPENVPSEDSINAMLTQSYLPALDETNAAMEATDVFGIIHVTGLIIVIGGDVFKHFETFELTQSTSDHHKFRLVLQNDITGTVQDHTMEDARKFLGSRISVTFTYKSFLRESPEREFIGVITQVGFNQSQGSKGSIVLSGESPTVLLNTSIHTQSFGGAESITLYSLAKELIKQGMGSSRYDINVNPTFKGELLYSCQYNESNHNYLARLAAAYGEWYYYDGRVLHFGKPPLADPIKLIYGKDTHEVKLQMKAVPVNQIHYGYNSSSHSTLATSAITLRGLGELGNFATAESKKIFKAPSLAVSPIRAVTDNEVQITQKSTAGAAAAEAFTLTGKTSVPFLYPGCLIEMNFRKPDSSDVRYFSRMIITAVSHSLDARGNYAGKFTAIPSDTEYLPAPEFKMPQAQPQLSTVVDNKDAQGRIRVQFDWQRWPDSTDFIRVATPDAGSSKAAGNNRGFVFIPEIDDQVMVNFEHGNPDKPFVQSGMFHGQNGLGGFEGNHKKSITTRSGCHIVIDDTEGKGSIHLADPSGNTWHMDGAGNVSVNAPGNINMTAGNNISFTAGMDILSNAGANINDNAAMNISSNAEENIRNFAAQSMLHNAFGDYSLEAANIKKVATGNIVVQSKNISKQASKDVKIISAEGNINKHAQKELQNNSGENTKNN